MDRFNLLGKQVAGKFEVAGIAAESRHTITYHATHIQTGDPYTLLVFKVLGDFTSDEREALLQNLIQSAVMVRRAADDNHVIAAAEEMGPLTLRQGQWVPYLAYASIDGSPLSTVIRMEQEMGLPPRSLAEVMELLEPVALALSTAHEHGVIHAGVTPDSILVMGDARSPLVDLRVVDFGVAQAITKARVAPSPISRNVPTGDTSQLTMTPTFHDAHFAAPEQVDFTGHQVGVSTDVYSLALVMTHLLTCGTDDPRLRRDPALYRATPGGRGVMLAPQIEDAFAAAMSRDPGERPANVMTFWNWLRGSHRMPALSLSGDAPSRPTLDMNPPDVIPAPAGSLSDSPRGSTDAIVRTMTDPPVVAPPRRQMALAAAIVAVVGAGGGAYLLSRPSAPPTPEQAAEPAATDVVQESIEADSSATAAAPTCPAGMAEIPAGQFFMGSDEHDALAFEKPAHQVKLSAYCIDTHEVSVAQYKACSDEGKCKRASKVNMWMDIEAKQRELFDPLCNMNDPEGKAQHPVNCVTWQMATSYCAENDKRLPTEAEWELAARGTDGRTYPWGDEVPTAAHLNACGTECAAWAKTNGQKLGAMYNSDDGHPHTAPVGSFPKGASKYGLVDVVGNVWEWVGDWYMPYTNEEQADPTGPERADKRVIRGGAWNGEHAAWVRPTFRYRDFPDIKSYGIGFRCAKSL